MKNELDLLRLLGKLAPEADAPSREAAHARLVAAWIDAGRVAVFADHRPRRGPRRRRALRVLLPAAGLAMLVALISLVLPALEGAPTAAAAALSREADIAAAQPDWTPEAGQFVYTKTIAAYLDGFTDISTDLSWSALIPRTREIWIGPDGSGRIHEVRGTPEFPSETDRQAWMDAGSPDLLPHGKVTDERFGAGNLYLDLSSVPTDPAALLQVIEARKVMSGPPGDWETFDIIGDLLRETDATPALRAALYRVAADLPGVELLGTVTDHEGRPGIGVAYTHMGVRHALVFDSQTSALLGEEYVQVDPEVGNASPPPGVGANADSVVDPGTVTGWAVYVSRGIVDSVSARP